MSPIRCGDVVVGTIQCTPDGRLEAAVYAHVAMGSEVLEVDFAREPNLLPEPKDEEGHVAHYAVMAHLGPILTKIGDATAHRLQSKTTMNLHLRVIPLDGKFFVDPRHS
jgi:hypothetical protein